MWRSRPALVALALAPLAGCAWLTQNHAATAEYARQVEIVSARAQEVENLLVEAEKRISQLEESVRAQGQSEATRLETVEQINTEISRLRGQIEELQFQVSEMQRYLDEGTIERERRMLHAERRIAAIEQFLRVKPPPPPTDAELGIDRSGDTDVDDTDEAAGGGTQEVETPATAEETLDLAIEHMQEGRHGVARALLEKALRDFPNAPQAAEIRYRIGQTWYNERQYSKAVAAYDEVLNKHPKSDWAPWALLGQAESVEGSGKKSEAKLFFEEVVRLYPKSDAAKEAKTKLGTK